MLPYADVCWHMLKYVDASNGNLDEKFRLELYAEDMTYSDVC